MDLTVEDIKKIVEPIAKKHGVERVWLFGSRARGDSKVDSDIDLHIEKGKILDYYEFTDFYLELQEALKTELDMVTTESIW
ncbi:MAG: nucleotidyltransferase domain-containing protein, partial [Deltaproteobacteria bacterium]|nr:nucleotidyltransferase domain-containing protein [Deltaproteobacteria bacterium]